jgi:hypothetical protein
MVVVAGTRNHHYLQLWRLARIQQLSRVIRFPDADCW